MGIFPRSFLHIKLGKYQKTGISYVTLDSSTRFYIYIFYPFYIFLPHFFFRETELEKVK